MVELLCLGISHKTAPIALRERVALMTGDAESLCKQLIELPTVDEAVAISTCNRTEVYLSGKARHAEPALLKAILDRGDLNPAELQAATFRPRNCDAARHLFSVTGGLDSMIVGEAEVQGQVKRAYEAALAAGTTGPMTNRLFSAALRTGKRIRSETLIGAGHASVPSVAVALAEETVGDLLTSKVVIVGAGETSELTAQEAQVDSAKADRGLRAGKHRCRTWRTTADADRPRRAARHRSCLRPDRRRHAVRHGRPAAVGPEEPAGPRGRAPPRRGDRRGVGAVRSLAK